jgi:NADPH-ferrihemoprotein reductase
VTLRTALSFFTDLHSSPHKEALLALASFATDKGEADRLAHMASPQGKGEYAEFVAKPRRSLLEVSA